MSHKRTRDESEPVTDEGEVESEIEEKEVKHVRRASMLPTSVAYNEAILASFDFVSLADPNAESSDESSESSDDSPNSQIDKHNSSPP